MARFGEIIGFDGAYFFNAFFVFEEFYNILKMFFFGDV